MTTPLNIIAEDFKFEYFVFEGGEEILLAFHGFGENADAFRKLSRIAGPKYTVIAVNHPFHGDSIPLKPGVMLKASTFERLINGLRKLHRFNEFSLLGYSLGAKSALQVLELFPVDIKSVYLFAPDGIIGNRWYNLAIRYRLTNGIFRKIIDRPAAFFKVVRLLGRLRILPPSLEKFIRMHMEEKEKRMQVYNVWHTYQRILPDIRKIKKLVNEHGIRTRLYFGKKDKVIPPKIGFYFIKGIEENAGLILFDSGHLLMTEQILGSIEW